MDEFDLIRRYFDRSCEDSSVLVGIGDDGAVLRPSEGRDLVSVVDTSVSGVHFPHGMSAADVGYRAVAVNLSDLAAMAARPRWMLLAVTLTEADPDWLSQFSAGLFDAAGAHELQLVGGDTTRGDTLVVTVNLVGDVEADGALRRSGASAGDQLWLTGSVGDAAAGLSLMSSAAEPDEDGRYLLQRFRRPCARVAFGRRIAAVASAAIDVSDGLHADLGHMLAASSVAARVDLNAIPLSPQLRRVCTDQSLTLAMTGGDDYELCFAAPRGNADAVRETARQAGVQVTCIGEAVAGEGITCVRDGEEVSFADHGYLHFKAS